MTMEPSRRQAVQAGAATLLAAGAAHAGAPQAAKTQAATTQAATTQAATTQAATNQGPPVWLGMDQKALDDAYTQSVYAPNAPQILARYASNSEIVRQRLGAPARHSYGEQPVEAIDVFSPPRNPGQPPQPVAVFIHGGAWRSGLARDYAFPAELFVGAGAHYAVADFTNVDQTGGDLTPMVDQVRQAIAWTYRNADSFGGDPNRIHLFGHSSGAHLAGVALITDWARYGVPGDVVKTALLCSGIYDLKPVRLSVRSTYVHFTDAIEAALSTERHVDRIVTPLVLAHGTNETPEFKRQTDDFAAALKSRGKPVERLIGENYNHFEMAETLASPYGVLGWAALRQIAG